MWLIKTKRHKHNYCLEKEKKKIPSFFTNKKKMPKSKRSTVGKCQIKKPVKYKI